MGVGEAMPVLRGGEGDVGNGEWRIDNGEWRIDNGDKWVVNEGYEDYGNFGS